MMKCWTCAKKNQNKVY